MIQRHTDIDVEVEIFAWKDCLSAARPLLDFIFLWHMDIDVEVEVVLWKDCLGAARSLLDLYDSEAYGHRR